METKTNADRIRAMTDEELATVLSTGGYVCDKIPEMFCDGAGCYHCCLSWLRSPVESEGEA